MLTYWIPDEPRLLPDGPSHQIGIGGFVINDKREVHVSSGTSHETVIFAQQAHMFLTFNNLMSKFLLNYNQMSKFQKMNTCLCCNYTL